MTPFDFDTQIDRRGTASEKWERYRDTDILPMWVADTDFMSPPGVIKALHERIDHGIFGYTDAPETLKKTVVDRMANKYNWAIESDWIVWLPGLVCGLNLSCRAVGNSQDTVIAPQPIYPPFITAPRLSDRHVQQIPMIMDGHRCVLDFKALEASLSENTQLLLFCNPQNPGGTVYTRDELMQLADIAERHDLTICSDEIHCDLILEQGLSHIPLASLSDKIAQRTITLMAPSKTYNIAGLGCSFAIIPNPQLRQHFNQVRKGIVPSVNLLGYTAAEAAYATGEEWNTTQLDYLRANRDYLVNEINQIPGLSLLPIEATYLAWIDISGAKLNNPVRFFEEAGIGMSPGRDFGDDRYMRLNFGCPRALLEEAVKRLRLALINHLPA